MLDTCSVLAKQAVSILNDPTLPGNSVDHVFFFPWYTRYAPFLSKAMFESCRMWILADHPNFQKNTTAFKWCNSSFHPLYCLSILFHEFLTWGAAALPGDNFMWELDVEQNQRGHKSCSWINDEKYGPVLCNYPTSFILVTYVVCTLLIAAILLLKTSTGKAASGPMFNQHAACTFFWRSLVYCPNCDNIDDWPCWTGT